MSVTNLVSNRLLSQRTLTGGGAGYTYAGVVDTIGHRLWGAYIDGFTEGDFATCSYVYAANSQCCGNTGYPNYSPYSCNYYKLDFKYGKASSSFNSSPSFGYKDGSNKGFKSFSIAGYGNSPYNETDAYGQNPCTSCNGGYSTQSDYLKAVSYFGDVTWAGIKESDSSLWTWGYGGNGAVGNSSYANQASPVKLGSNSWIMVAGGPYYCFAAIRSDNTLWVWGNNIYGQLGTNDTTTRNSPVQVAGSWKYITCSEYGMSAIKTDDTLWSWGYNGNGAVGDNTVTTRSSPVQVSGGGSWKFVYKNSFYNTYGIKTDGTMYGWGYNGYYTVGDGTGTYRSSPVQIGSSYSDWVHISSNGSYAGQRYAIRSNGTAYAWGWYPLGLSSNSYPSVTQIGTATNHASCSLNTTSGYDYINGNNGAPFISTSGNLIMYTGYNSTQTTVYNGGSATNLVRGYNNNTYGGEGTYHLIKYVR